MNIIFWQDMPSQHQASAIKCLAEKKDYNVYCIFSHMITSDRVEQGWRLPDFGNATIYWVQKDKNEIEILQNLIDNTVHVFNGLLTYPRLSQFFKVLKMKKAQIIVMAEAAWQLGLRKYLALIKWWINIKRYDNAIRLYLTFGHVGEKFYHKIGVSDKKIIRYAYQVDVSPMFVNNRSISVKDKLKILFIGQLIYRKGVDVLINAVSKIDSNNISLSIIGNGKEKNKLERLVDAKGLLNRVTFLGTYDNEKVPMALQEHDLLIVPSRHDGWAAVTNEALQCGTPVIISDAAGASDLISGSGAGCVFKNGDTNMLAEILKKLINDNLLLEKYRNNALRVAPRISGETVGLYFQSVINYVQNNYIKKPDIPWEIMN